MYDRVARRPADANGYDRLARRSADATAMMREVRRSDIRTRSLKDQDRLARRSADATAIIMREGRLAILLLIDTGAGNEAWRLRRGASKKTIAPAATANHHPRT